MAERTLSVDDVREQRLLFGSLDRNLRAIRERFGVSVSTRRGTLRIAGDDEAAVREVATRIATVLQRVRRKGEPPSDAEIYESLVDDDSSAGDLSGESAGGRGSDAGPVDELAGIGRARHGAGSHRGRGTNGAHGPHASGGPHGPHAAHANHGSNGASNGGASHPGATGGKKPTLPPSPLPEIRPLSENQRAYVEAIASHDVVFGIGPAGTGKTYLAVAAAVAALREGTCRKIMLTRPAVEAGEKLGFLPGDFQAKINPYLRPLYDALEEMLRFGEVQRSIDNGLVEIVPLAYMRGRTLKNAFIILDEAQNTTPAQMKMFLTRMGSGSKIVVTGDVTQMDLPEGVTSGLVEASRVLRGVKGLAFVEFKATDIIRHAMVQRIVDAYERADAAKAGGEGPSAAS